MTMMDDEPMDGAEAHASQADADGQGVTEGDEADSRRSSRSENLRQLSDSMGSLNDHLVRPFASVAEQLAKTVALPLDSARVLSQYLARRRPSERKVRRFRISRSAPLPSLTAAATAATASLDTKDFALLNNSAVTTIQAQSVSLDATSAPVATPGTIKTLSLGDEEVEMNCFGGKRLTANRIHYTASVENAENEYAQSDSLDEATGVITVERETVLSQAAANLLTSPAVSPLPEGYPAAQPDAAVVYTDDTNTQYYEHTYPFTDGCVQTEFWLNQTFLHVPDQLSNLLEIDLPTAQSLVTAVKKQPGEGAGLEQVFTREDVDAADEGAPERVPASRGKETVSWRSLATRVCQKIVEKYTGPSAQPPAYTQTATNQNVASTSPGFEGQYPLGSDLDVCRRLAQCRRRDSLRSQPETLEFCACPYDYAGTHCQTPRSIQCYVREHPFDSSITCSNAHANVGRNPYMHSRGFSNAYDSDLIGWRPCREVPNRDPAVANADKYGFTWRVVPYCQFGVLASVDINSPDATPEELRNIVWQGPPPAVRRTLEEGEFTWDQNYNFDYVIFRPLHDGSNATLANRDSPGAVPPRFALSVPSIADGTERAKKAEAIVMETYLLNHDRVNDRKYSVRTVVPKAVLEEIDLWSAAQNSNAQTEADMDSTAIKITYDLKAPTVTDALPSGSPLADDLSAPIPRSTHQRHYFPGGRATVQSRIVFESAITYPFATESFVAMAQDAQDRGVTLVPQPLLGTGAEGDSRPALKVTPQSRGAMAIVDVVRYDPGAPKSRPLTSIQKVIIGVSCAAFVLIVIMIIRWWLAAREREMFRRAKEEAAERAARVRLERQAAGLDPDDTLAFDETATARFENNATSAGQLANLETPLASSAAEEESKESEPSSRKRAVFMRS